ncbi:hypothetical protein CLU84_4030 [Comamonas sp. 26]|nr:hypothetical protein CLU84_4030 [Comamonas sp. 26]
MQIPARYEKSRCLVGSGFLREDFERLAALAIHGAGQISHQAGVL